MDPEAGALKGDNKRWMMRGGGLFCYAIKLELEYLVETGLQFLYTSRSWNLPSALLPLGRNEIAFGFWLSAAHGGYRLDLHLYTLIPV